MTANKAHGKTLFKVDIYIYSDFYGQLYVALYSCEDSR